MFAGSCIATICLVLCLEFLRRMGREYDAFILRRAHSAALASKFPARRRPRRVPSFFLSNGQKCSCDCPIVDGSITAASTSESSNAKLTGPNNITPVAAEAVHSINDGVANRNTSEHFAPYRPSPVEQVIRALLHMVQFAVAYFIMLLAMYYNGYIIICIFIGAFLGSLIFSWEPLSLSKE
jgi:copper transporter 1